ncbi:hypothetical protein DPMN_159505 [Dreissena polymorpha]|uniref:Uncharacterized protein n=2 Tax=Dreissena polymorpha TaxID=45954 RepID=A0A9D4EP98_DREPO|nr:hypothetical protein DPMN_159505 [Dreissena polymorpha]
MKNIVRKWTASVKKCCKKTKNEHSSPCAADGPWDDAGFWRKVVQEYTAREDAKADKDAKANRLDDVLTLIQEDLRRQQKDNKRLNDRMLEIERLIKAQATGQGSSD